MLNTDNREQNNKTRNTQRDIKTKQRKKLRDTTATANVNASISNKEAARSAVFGTTELLENILSFLPPAAILTKAQRVSRAWHDVVKTSPKIQTKLWMRPEKAAKPTSPLQFSEAYGASSGTTLRGLRKIQKFGLRRMLEDQLPVYSDELVMNKLLTNRYNANALFADGCVSVPATIGVLRPLTVMYDAVRVLFDGLGQTIQQRRRTRQSWLNMYLTSPPITTVQVEVALPQEQGDEVVLIPSHVTVRDEAGLTCGTIVEVIEKMREAVPNSLRSEMFYASSPAVWFVAENPTYGENMRITSVW